MLDYFHEKLITKFIKNAKGTIFGPFCSCLDKTTIPWNSVLTSFYLILTKYDCANNCFRRMNIRIDKDKFIGPFRIKPEVQQEYEEMLHLIY